MVASTGGRRCYGLNCMLRMAKNLCKSKSMKLEPRSCAIMQLVGDTVLQCSVASYMTVWAATCIC